MYANRPSTTDVNIISTTNFARTAIISDDQSTLDATREIDAQCSMNVTSIDTFANHSNDLESCKDHKKNYFPPNMNSQSCSNNFKVEGKP